ncbi:DUF4145 domain-containing protein [Methylobacterium sp. Leaf86]|uniref:DUF4145 domain-containing protein n=1 Tax=Methylobacterium sp. Leaf86 TaxID=1736242 RepID=UPI000B291B4D|nr:DUF4145 domain-containing protein [Methylobacterium sp. Leaf86]
MEYSHAMARLDDFSDREAAVMVASLIDSGLQMILETGLHFDNSQDRDKFFGLGKGSNAGAPGGSLANKIDLCESLTILSRNVCSNIRHIKNIRNTFAHSMQHIDFDDANFMDDFSKLNITTTLRDELPGGEYSDLTPFVAPLGMEAKSYKGKTTEIEIPAGSFFLCLENNNESSGGLVVAYYIFPGKNEPIKDYGAYISDRSQTAEDYSRRVKFIRSVKFIWITMFESYAKLLSNPLSVNKKTTPVLGP